MFETVVIMSYAFIYIARWFLTRAIHSAKNHDAVLQIITNKGSGVSDGFSLNIAYAKAGNDVEMYNVEVAPPPTADFNNDLRESQVSVREIPKGESYVHCNRWVGIWLLFSYGLYT